MNARSQIAFPEPVCGETLAAEPRLHYMLHSTSLCGRFRDLPEPDQVIHPMPPDAVEVPDGRCCPECAERLDRLNATAGVLFVQEKIA